MWKEGKDSFGFDLSVWVDDRTLTGVRSLREEKFGRRKQEFCLGQGEFKMPAGHAGRNVRDGRKCACEALGIAQGGGFAYSDLGIKEMKFSPTVLTA